MTKLKIVFHNGDYFYIDWKLFYDGLTANRIVDQKQCAKLLYDSFRDEIDFFKTRIITEYIDEDYLDSLARRIVDKDEPLFHQLDNNVYDSDNIDNIIKNHYDIILKITDGNQSKAAKMLGITPRKLHYQIRKYNIKWDSSKI